MTENASQFPDTLQLLFVYRFAFAHVIYTAVYPKHTNTVAILVPSYILTIHNPLFSLGYMVAFNCFSETVISAIGAASTLLFSKLPKSYSQIFYGCPWCAKKKASFTICIYTYCCFGFDGSIIIYGSHFYIL